MYLRTHSQSIEKQSDARVPAGSSSTAGSEGEEERYLSLGDSQLQGHPWKPAAFPPRALPVGDPLSSSNCASVVLSMQGSPPPRRDSERLPSPSPPFAFAGSTCDEELVECCTSYTFAVVNVNI